MNSDPSDEIGRFKDYGLMVSTKSDTISLELLLIFYILIADSSDGASWV